MALLCRSRFNCIHWFYVSLKTFRRNVFKIKALQTGHRAERSCSLRPRKAVAFLTHLLRVPRSMGTGNFAVCGQRLRGHVPSKNTSPAALSWSSLIGQLDEICSVSARIRSVFRTTAIFFCAAKKLRHFPNLFGSWRSFFIFPQLSRSGTALRSYFFLRPFFRLVAAATANAASAVGTRTTANASLVFGVLLMFCAR